MKESLQSVRQNFCSYFLTNSNQQNPQTNFLNSVNSTSRNIGVGSFASNLALVVICFLAFNLAFAAKPLTSNVFIDKALVDFPNVESGDQTVFQLFSHGRSGELFLDGEWKNAEQIASFVKARISNSSSKVNTLNIYGCEFAKDQKGIDAVNYLQATLNINIAASNNITGQDGDWILEMGKVKSSISVANYKGNLQTTVYVNAAATGTNNGSSWTNGYKTLDAALKANLNTANLLVKVAAGTYNEPSNAQATLKGANVSIIGGFDIVSGISSPSTTPSILNYSATTTAGGTSQSVGIINYAGTGGSFLMEGLTVQNLNQAALGGGVPTSSNFRGTSFYINNTNTTSPQLFRNLTLTNNTKVTDLFQIGNPWPLGSPTSTSSVTFDNVKAIGNSTSMGVLNYVGTGDLTVLNSEFCTNSSSGNFAGGIYYQSLTGGLLVNNTLFQKNTLSNGTNLHAGAILICNEYSNNMNASISITDSYFIANTDAAGYTGVNCAGAIYVSGFLTQGSVLIDNNQFINNQGPYTGALEYTSSVNGIVSNNTFNGNKGTGTYGLSGAIGGSGSLTVSNNTFANNTGTAGGAIYGNGFNSIALDGNNFYNNTRTNTSTTFPTDIFLYNSTGSLSNNYLQSASTLYTSEGLTLGSGNNFNGVGAIPVSTVPTPTECVEICKANTSVILSSTNITNICPSTTVDLTPLVTSTAPLETSLVWFTNSTHTGTAYTTPTEATAGTYYAFYFDDTNNCYSPASVPVTVTILNCNSCKLGGTAWYDYNGEGNPADGMQGAFPIGSSIEKEVTGAETIAPANINNIAAAKLVGVNATFPYIGGVANVQTTLYNATTSEFVASKVTDSKGNYIFTNLTCDNYYMVTFDINGFTAPDGVAINAVAPNQGTNNLKDSDGVYDLKAAKFVTEPVLLSGPNAEDYSLDFGVSAAILPIVLKSFDGNGNDCKVALTWVTSIEKDNKQFIVERSLDGSKFVPVGTLAGKRNSSEETTYSFTDANIAANGYYYRLIQEDIDGTRSIVSSKYISSACQKYNQTGISGMYPNPVSGNVKTLVKYNSNLAVNGILTLMSMEGKVLITQNHQFIEGINNLSVDLSTLPAGSYIIQVSGEGLPLSVNKLLKTE